jgi:hypothetical protein
MGLRLNLGPACRQDFTRPEGYATVPHVAAFAKPLITLTAVVAVLLAILALIAVTRRGHLSPALYQRSKALFSPAELAFLAALESALGSSCRVLGKVRIADLAEVKPGLTPRVHQAALNRAAYKHFDFVVCAASSYEPLCAVELNDSSHSTKRAKRRDALVASVCEQIALPLVTFTAARSYEAAQIRERIAPALRTSHDVQNTSGSR